MDPNRPSTVVVTGASGSIGRAVAQAFGHRGATVGLLAWGRLGLDGAAGDRQQTNQPRDPDHPVKLWDPADGPDGHDFGAHGMFDDTSHGRAPRLWASRHHDVMAAAVEAASLTAALWARRAKA
jgi:NAD(P)-dependent dehydrogenase (short-subunit alcohol dehydrogenase family)